MNCSLVGACPEAGAYVERESEGEGERDQHKDCGAVGEKNNVTLISARGGESRVHDVMLGSRFSVAEKVQHAHIPLDVMDNPCCKVRPGCHSDAWLEQTAGWPGFHWLRCSHMPWL